jgi:hypothetical protein
MRTARRRTTARRLHGEILEIELKHQPNNKHTWEKTT